MSAAASLLRFKLGSAALTLAVAALGTALPWIFHRMLSERAFRLLSLGNMLSVGVMLGGGLLHLLPEAVEGAAAEGFPFPYLTFSLGLLLPLCIEQLLHAHDGGAHDLLQAHELKQPSSNPSSHLLVAGPSAAEGNQLRSRRVRGDPHDLSERQLVDQDSSLRSDSGPDVLDQLSQDEEDEGAAQLAKLPLMSVLVLQVALSFHAD
jgi:hypothetical protein